MPHVAIVGVLLFTLSSPPAPAAWQLTDEERLDRRFDPRSIRARVERAVAEGLTPADVLAGSRESVIIGEHTPELFLPFELFSSLIRDGFDSDESRRNAYRQRFAEIIAEPNPEEFWLALEQAARPYVENIREEMRLAGLLNAATSAEDRAPVLAEIEIVQKPQCGLRHDALVAVTDRLGRETLYRVLYEGIATGMAMRSGGPESRERLSFVARGCR